MSSEERADSLAAQAAAWVPPWERRQEPDREYQAAAEAEADALAGLQFAVDAPQDLPDEDEDPQPTEEELGPELPLPEPVEEAAEAEEAAGGPAAEETAAREPDDEDWPEEEGHVPVDAPTADAGADWHEEVAVEQDGVAALDTSGESTAVQEGSDAVQDRSDAVRDGSRAGQDGGGAVRDGNGAGQDGGGAVRDGNGAGQDGGGAVRDVGGGYLTGLPAAEAESGRGGHVTVPVQGRGPRDDRAVVEDDSDRTPVVLDEVDLAAALESIMLVVDEPVGELQLAQVMEQPVERVARALEDISARYTAAGHGIDLRRVAGGWRLYTRPEYAHFVERFVLDGQSVRLTQAALETLSVVAYKQPVTRSRISAIRGVNCDGVMRTLNTRGLIEECGTEPETGAYLYRTTVLFLEKLGLNSIDQLPPLAPFLPDDVEEVLDASG